MGASSVTRILGGSGTRNGGFPRPPSNPIGSGSSIPYGNNSGAGTFTSPQPNPPVQPSGGGAIPYGNNSGAFSNFPRPNNPQPPQPVDYSGVFNALAQGALEQAAATRSLSGAIKGGLLAGLTFAIAGALIQGALNQGLGSRGNEGRSIGVDGEEYGVVWDRGPNGEEAGYSFYAPWSYNLGEVFESPTTGQKFQYIDFEGAGSRFTGRYTPTAFRSFQKLGAPIEIGGGPIDGPSQPLPQLGTATEPLADAIGSILPGAQPQPANAPAPAQRTGTNGIGQPTKGLTGPNGTSIDTVPGSGVITGTSPSPQGPKTEIIVIVGPAPPSNPRGGTQCPDPCPPNSEVDLSEVIRLLNELKTSVGDGATDNFTDLTSGIENTLTTLGFTEESYTTRGNGTSDNIRESLKDLSERIGHDDKNAKIRFQDVEQPADNLEKSAKLVHQKLGFENKYYPLGEDFNPDTSLPPILLSGALDEIRLLPSEVVNIQGIEKTLYSSSLKITFTYGPVGFRCHARLTVPSPRSSEGQPITRATILAKTPNYIRGQFYCALELQGGRKVSGWFESKESGQAYLTELAKLSELGLMEPLSFSATFKTSGYPTKFEGEPLSPSVAEVFRDGDIKERISLRLPPS